METTPLSIRLLHASSSSSDGYWELEVEEERSGLMVLSVKLDADQFAALVGTNAYQVITDGSLYIDNADRWGMRRENVSINAPGITYGTWDERDALIADAAEGYFAAGWRQFRIDKTINAHLLSDEGYTIFLERWVEDTPTTA